MIVICACVQYDACIFIVNRVMAFISHIHVVNMLFYGNLIVQLRGVKNCTLVARPLTLVF